MITSMAPNHRKQEGHQAQTEGGLSFVQNVAMFNQNKTKIDLKNPNLWGMIAQQGIFLRVEKRDQRKARPT